MATLLRIDPEFLPRTLVLDPPVTDAEFEALCRDSRSSIQFERTKEGVVRMNPPAGGFTGSGNQEIAAQLNQWWRTHESGRLFDSSTGFHLPDGSILGPDASFVSQERLSTLPKGELRGFPHVCPDFVIELLSESDRVRPLEEKMRDWIVNGTLLAWLIDPYRQQVPVFRPNRETESIAGERVAGDGPLEGFVLDLTRVWKCYQD